ncbi:MAG TPA: helix-turn-helix transcriptional regulator [Anaerolineales bacterium]|nr:helix-turn-helix transcriptional regulator [Anaerolineales bacterium]
MLHKDVLISLCQARDMLRDTGDGTLSVQDVAREVGMSPFHFIRLFKAVFGETPKQCQLRARLERAKVLLMMTEASVTDICMEVGFSSLGTFSYVFARRVGVAPSAYRAAARSMMKVPGETPKQLIPGCLSLMSGSPG